MLFRFLNLGTKGLSFKHTQTLSFMEKFKKKNFMPQFKNYLLQYESERLEIKYKDLDFENDILP